MAVKESTMEGLGMNYDFWRDKRVLLTGHTGFKGSWLSLWLSSLGADVIGVALPPPTCPSLFEISGIGRKITNITCDVRDLDHLQSVFFDHQPEIVIHMAAQSLVRASYDDPIGTYSTNMMGTVNLFEAVRKTKSVRAVINVTTDKCYDNDERLSGYVEADSMGGFDPYSSSKGCSELITAAYRNSYFLPEKYSEHNVAVATARAGNVIGGGDWAKDRLIPDVIRSITESRALKVRNPNAIRPWQHVLEPLSGYLILAQKLYENKGDYAEAWNFGPGEDDVKSVSWIVDYLNTQFGGFQWELDDDDQPHEANYLKLDCLKASQRLNWSPKWKLPEALRAIVEWQKGYLENLDMELLMIEQIKKYSKK